MKNLFRSKWLFLLIIAAASAIATKGRFMKISQSMENFAQAYRIINDQYVDEVDPNQLMRIGIDTMLSRMDPYTNYFSEAQMVQVRMGVRGGWDGIGIEVMEQNEQIVIKELVEGTPAEENNLRVGDILLKIDGTEVAGRPVESIAQTLQGKAGTKVSIEVKRPSTGEQRSLSLERTKVTKKNVPYYGMVDDKTGYIVLTTFSQQASKNVQEAFQALKNTHQPERLILDLRNNGGGFLMEAVNICNLFVRKGNEIVYTKAKIPEWDRSFKTLNQPLDLDIPLIVLINGSSASASEIVAGALQDLDRAVLLGSNSFGKGLVQNTKDIGYSSKVKLTTAKYYIPSGRCVQALDYENGKPVAVPDSLRKGFKTNNGRAVFDGKGLEPDYKTGHPDPPLLIKMLEDKHFFFDYANAYREKKDTIVDAKTFKLTPKEVADFIASFQDNWLKYTTKTEQHLVDLEEAAKDRPNYEETKVLFAQARAKIKAAKLEAIQTHKTSIQERLEQEIVGRYYYMTGQVENRLANDKDIAAALGLFEDKAAFDKLLAPASK